MTYFVISPKNKKQNELLSRLFVELGIKATVLNEEQMEDKAFIAAMKDAEKSGKAKLSDVERHLRKVISGK